MQINVSDIDRLIKILENKKKELLDTDTNRFEFIGRDIPPNWCIKGNNEEECKIIYNYICTHFPSVSKYWCEEELLTWYLHMDNYNEYDGGKTTSKPGYVILSFDKFLDFIKDEN